MSAIVRASAFLVVIVAIAMTAATIAHAQSPPTYVSEWGEGGTAPGQLQTPRDIAVDSYGSVYVTDYTRLQKFDRSGVFLDSWTFGGSLGLPTCIAIDRNDNVYCVVVSDTERVWKHSALGAADEEWELNIGAQDIALDPRGRVCILTWDKSLVRFSQSGAYIDQLHLTSLPLPDIHAAALAIDPRDGSFYVSFFGPSFLTDIRKYTEDGTHAVSWSAPGNIGASGLDVDASGNLYSAHINRCQKFSSAGTFLFDWAIVSGSHGQSRVVSGVATDLYVLDGSGTPRVQRYRQTWCDLFPSAGFVAVRASSAGLGTWASTDKGAIIDLHLVAFPGCMGSLGGADFRIEVTGAEGYLFSYQPPQGAQVSLTPFDVTPGVPDAAGTTILLQSCAAAGADGTVDLGRVLAYNAFGGDATLTVKAKSPLEQPSMACPRLFGCAPGFTPECMAPVVEFASQFNLISSYKTPTDSPLGPTPNRITVFPNAPDPFNPATTLKYMLAASGHVRVGVYDVRGELVRVLFAGEQVPGYHEVRWDGRLESGARAASGRYFVYVATDREAQSESVTLMK